MGAEEKKDQAPTTTEESKPAVEIPADDGHQMSQSEIDALIAMLLK